MTDAEVSGTSEATPLLLRWSEGDARAWLFRELYLDAELIERDR